MPSHASPQPSRRSGPWKRPAQVVAAVAVALVPATLASGLLTPISEPATVGVHAARIWETRAGTLTFPMEPVPMCLLVTKFGGYSKVNGSGGHQGIDIGSTEGQHAYAADDGVISLIDDDPSGAEGISVRMISDDDVQFRYYHLAALADGLTEGQRVRRGAVIGYVGDTGNATPGGYHLHFEVRPDAPYRTPVDPVPLLAVPDVCRGFPAATTTTSTTSTTTSSAPGTSVPR